MKFSRTISLIISLLLILAAIIGYSSFVAPIIDKAKALRAEMQAKSESYAEQRAAIDSVKSLFAQFEENATLQETLKSVLPVGDAKAAVLLEQIRGLAVLNNLALQTLSIRQRQIEPSFLGVPLAGGIGVVSIEFAASGGYQSLKGFLADLETNVRLMDISVLSAETVVDGDLLNVNFIINSYYQSRASE